MAINNLNSGVGIQPTIVDAKGDLIVATGADAVNRLAVGTANQQLVVDSSTSTGLKWAAPAGLVLLNTTSFSGVSAASLPASTFSSTYDNYKILYTVQASTSVTYNLRLRNAGSDISTSNYFRNGLFAGDSAATNIAGVITTSWNALPSASTQTSIEIDLFSPNLAENTRGFFRGYDTSLGNYYNQVLLFNLNTQVDALTLYPSTGTITGRYSVYGLSK